MVQRSDCRRPLQRCWLRRRRRLRLPRRLQRSLYKRRCFWSWLLVLLVLAWLACDGKSEWAALFSPDYYHGDSDFVVERIASTVRRAPVSAEETPTRHKTPTFPDGRVPHLVRQSTATAYRNGESAQLHRAAVEIFL